MTQSARQTKILSLVFLFALMGLFTQNVNALSCRRILTENYDQVRTQELLANLLNSENVSDFKKGTYRLKSYLRKHKGTFLSSDDLRRFQHASIGYFPELTPPQLSNVLSVIYTSVFSGGNPEDSVLFRFEEEFILRWDKEFVKRMAIERSSEVTFNYYINNIAHAVATTFKRYRFAGTDRFELGVLDALVKLLSLRMTNGHIVLSTLGRQAAVRLDTVLTGTRYTAPEEFDIYLPDLLPPKYISRRRQSLPDPFGERPGFESIADSDLDGDSSSSGDDGIDYVDSRLLNNGIFYDDDY